MATVRKTGTGFELIDLTTEILEMDNQYGLLNDMGLFSGEGVETDSVTFDKEDTQIVLMNQTNRGGKPVYGKDRNRTLHALPIPYYKRVDTVTVKDIRGQRRLGSEDMEDVANAVAKKLTDMRMAADQTIEWQKLHALKGITLDSQGNTIANMFTEFGITQDSVDFLLGTAGTDVPAKIREVQTLAAKKARTGGRIGMVNILCSDEFFDKLVAHQSIKDAYAFYLSGFNPLRDSTVRFQTWGVTKVFEFHGVRFIAYDTEFNREQAAGAGVETVSWISSNTATEGGYAFVEGMRDVYKGYFAPAERLSLQGEVGSEMYVFQFPDNRDTSIDLEIEMAGLYVNRKPQVAIKCVSSN